jgi:hypothetical protein
MPSTGRTMFSHKQEPFRQAVKVSPFLVTIKDMQWENPWIIKPVAIDGIERRNKLSNMKSYILIIPDYPIISLVAHEATKRQQLSASSWSN